MTADVTRFAELDRDARLEQVARAHAIAVMAHSGQVDKLGVDYIQHPEAVAASFDPVEDTLEHCAALLHDVLEDAAIEGNLRVVSGDLLVKAGIRPEVIAVVELLTRRGDDGDVYYQRIAADSAARAVKLSDIRHNTDPARTARLPDDQRKRLEEKYDHARELLGPD
jgi:(p)ppGpp synthase/HD superfamily hydrolase